MRHASHDYAFRGGHKLGGAKWPWAVSITAIRANEVVRRGTRQTPCIFNLVEEPSSLSLSQPQYIHGIYILPLEDQRRVSFFFVAIEPCQATRKAAEKMGAAKESIDLKRLWRVVSLVKWKLKGRHSLCPFAEGGGHCSAGFFSTPAY